MICLKLDSYTKSHIHKFKYTVDTVFLSISRNRNIRYITHIGRNQLLTCSGFSLNPLPFSFTAPLKHPFNACFDVGTNQIILQLA